MMIYTYYENCRGISGYDSLKLIMAWRAAWSAVGFQPFVLTEHQARAHPDFSEFDVAISKLPTINASTYEKACYHRHIAMAQVGGGLLADYDVFCTDVKRVESAIDNAEAKLTLFQTKNVCPSMVLGSADEYLAACKRFASYVPKPTDLAGDRPHTSDMLIFEQQAIHEPGTLGLIDLVRCYGEVNEATTGAIHFSNGSMAKETGPRWKRIKEILAC